MLIDWFTVGAQALNFIVLVWLMKRFLYKPILDAIDVREKRIAAELADADKKKAEAKSDRDDLQHKNEAFDQQRAALLAKATTDADVERQKQMTAVRQAADALAAARRQTLASEASNLSQALRERARVEVFALARKTLADLASASLEATICDAFIVRLRALQGSARDDLAAALASSKQGALVRTAFELPTAQRSVVEKAVDETFATTVAVRFEVAPTLVSGIELSADGHKFAWSIEDYLASLERSVGELLKPAARLDQAASTPPPKPAPTPAPVPAVTPA